MASIATDPRGNRRILFTHPHDRRRKTLRLGRCPKRDAEAVAGHVESLIGTLRRGRPPAGDALDWLASLPCDFLARVAAVGLCEPPADGDDAPATLAGVLDAVLDAKAVELKPSSVRRMRQARDRLCRHLGGDRDPATITPDDAAAWRAAMLAGGLGRATVRSDAAFAKTLWNAAEARGLVPRVAPPPGHKGGGPFALLDAGTTERQAFRYVTPAEAAAVVAELPDARWRLLFGLAYYAGLRCPSETHGLTWADVDWHRGRLDVRSPKTERHRGHERRAVPIDPLLMPLLRDAFDLAEPGETRAVSLAASHTRGTYEAVGRAVRRAGVEPWDALWLTLRASAEIRWIDAGHPSSHVARWMGHGVTVAERHYRRAVPDDSFARAAGLATTAPHSAPRGAESGALPVVTGPHPAAPTRVGASKRGSAWADVPPHIAGGETRTPTGCPTGT